LSTPSITSVATNTKITAAFNQLYLTAIAVSPNIQVDNIEGLGLKWNPLESQCAGNNMNNLSLYYALGAPKEDDFITARFNSAIPFQGESTIAVYRYSGVDPAGPIGNITKSNSNGLESGANCDNIGQISDNFSLSASTSQPDSVIFSAISSDKDFLEPENIYNLRSKLPSFTVADRFIGKIEKDISLTGKFSASSDWSLISVEIIADTNKPKNIMRHGKWFDSTGLKQPFTL